MEDLNLIYKGAHSNDLYTAYFDGTKWHGNTKISSQNGSINPQSDSNPGVAVFNNWLYLVYKSADSSDLCCAWFDGIKWNGNVKISAMQGGISPKSNFSPNIAVYNNMLYMVYLTPDSYELYSAWFDGTTWFGNKKINDQSGGIDPESAYNPAIAAFNGLLYIIYKGKFFNDLYSANFNGITWDGNHTISSQPGKISPKSSYSPGICVYNNKLYLGYLGSHSSNIYTAYFDGTTWFGNTPISDQPGGISPSSNYNPGMDVFKSKMFLVYKGSWFSDLYTAEFDGTNWSGNTKISSQPGGISPGSNYNPGVSVTSAIPGMQANWMEKLADATPICDINIPGTHDSAAINSSIHTPFACHNNTITQQLEYGIRMLDVRLKINKNGNTFSFMTCHGDKLGNEYQTFPSLMDECNVFLNTNKDEVILMSLKIDNWNNLKKDYEAQVYDALKNLLSSYPVTSQKTMPALGSVRGKIFLYNRMNRDLSFGVPIWWDENTSGSYAIAWPSGRSYNVYVQDQYEGLPLVGSEKKKYDLVKAAFGMKKSGEALLNFASATWYSVFGVYIMGDLLNYFGQNVAAQRPAKFGWTMFDYAFNNYNTNTYGSLNIVTIVIASNFNYQGYPDKFKVVSDGKDEL